MPSVWSEENVARTAAYLVGLVGVLVLYGGVVSGTVSWVVTGLAVTGFAVLMWKEAEEI